MNAAPATSADPILHARRQVFQSMSLPILIGIFLLAAGVIWAAGIQLSNTTDAIADHFHLGQALGGLIILAVATNLPEIAISVTAGLGGQVALAVGNILGGIGIQTVILFVLDAATPDHRPLTRQVKSLLPVLEGSLVIAVLVLVVLAKQLPPTLALGGLGPGEIGIAATWIGGIFLLNKARQGLPWQVAAEEGRRSDQDSDGDETQNDQQEPAIGRTLAIFAGAALATLAAGFSIEQASESIAQQLGMTGAVFGATFLAAATALPEVSTGLQAIKLRDTQLAISDIFGGNAFLPVLFLLVGILSGRPVIAQSKAGDLYVAALGMLLTTIYLGGLVFHSERRMWRVGLDSIAVLIVFVLGILGLFAVPGG